MDLLKIISGGIQWQFGKGGREVEARENVEFDEARGLERERVEEEIVANIWAQAANARNALFVSRS